ncbi:DNA invertase Pin-like site-specific DNA recombinase [Kitasatospora sp. MAA4]|nr:DNA invertase Pin-like site-specific DNA recombinase [Kitasatospora sp. MAA4]
MGYLYSSGMPSTFALNLPDEDLFSEDPYEPDCTLTLARVGVLRGYGRVSTKDQNLARQTKALLGHGCIKPLYLDKASGKNAERERLEELFADLQPGDTVVVTSLDRLGRNLDDLIQIVKRIKAAGAALRSLAENIDTGTPVGRLIFHIFGAIAQFVREIINETSREGLELAKARGVKLGRPSSMTPEKIAYALHLLDDPEQSISSIAKLLGVSRTTLYTALPQLRGLRPSGRPKALPAALEAVALVEEGGQIGIPTPSDPGPLPDCPQIAG